MSWATMLRKSTGVADGAQPSTPSNSNNNVGSVLSTPPLAPAASTPSGGAAGLGLSRGGSNSRGGSTSLPSTPPLASSSSLLSSSHKLASAAPSSSAIGHQNQNQNQQQQQHSKGTPRNKNSNNKSSSSREPSKEQPQQQQHSSSQNLSFKLSPALPHGTSTRPPPLVLTTTISSTSSSNNATIVGSGGDSSSSSKNGKTRCYSRAQIVAVGAAVMGGPPNVRTIESLLSTCPDIVNDGCYEVLRREQIRREQQLSYECSTCSMFDMTNEEINNKGTVRAPPAGACAQMHELIKNSLKDCRSTRGLTFLCQAPDVVFGQLRVAVAFDPKSSSKKMREMPERCVDRVKAFICGDGFHFPAPKQGDSAAWQKFSRALKFDSIMDNQTPLFAGLGKYWKKTHSPFEKFVQILFWRDEPPNPHNYNMISKNQMPVIVACAAGDIDAAVMLMHLKFFVLADDYLFGFPFMRNLEPLKASVLRHLCRYFYRKQTERALASRSLAQQKQK